jgi:hypothetical protein
MAATETEVPKKQQLEENIRASDNFRKAVRRGTFQGSDCLAIGGLLKFLDDQHDINLAEYEALSMKNPDWGRPSDISPSGAKA